MLQKFHQEILNGREGLKDLRFDITLEMCESAEQGEGITRCICGFTHDDGYMIWCDGCSVWQNLYCMDLDPSDLPEFYYCETCHPLPVNLDRAIQMQQRFRAFVSVDGGDDTALEILDLDVQKKWIQLETEQGVSLGRSSVESTVEEEVELNKLRDSTDLSPSTVRLSKEHDISLTHLSHFGDHDTHQADINHCCKTQFSHSMITFSRASCSVCLRVMPLTQIGLVRIQGPVISRCPGSHLLPVSVSLQLIRSPILSRRIFEALPRHLVAPPPS